MLSPAMDIPRHPHRGRYFACVAREQSRVARFYVRGSADVHPRLQEARRAGRRPNLAYGFGYALCPSLAVARQDEAGGQVLEARQ